MAQQSPALTDGQRKYDITTLESNGLCLNAWGHFTFRGDIVAEDKEFGVSQLKTPSHWAAYSHPLRLYSEVVSLCDATQHGGKHIPWMVRHALSRIKKIYAETPFPCNSFPTLVPDNEPPECVVPRGIPFTVSSMTSLVHLVDEMHNGSLDTLPVVGVEAHDWMFSLLSGDTVALEGTVPPVYPTSLGSTLLSLKTRLSSFSFSEAALSCLVRRAPIEARVLYVGRLLGMNAADVACYGVDASVTAAALWFSKNPRLEDLRVGGVMGLCYIFENMSDAPHGSMDAVYTGREYSLARCCLGLAASNDLCATAGYHALCTLRTPPLIETHESLVDARGFMAYRILNGGSQSMVAVAMECGGPFPGMQLSLRAIMYLNDLWDFGDDVDSGDPSSIVVYAVTVLGMTCSELAARAMGDVVIALRLFFQGHKSALRSLLACHLYYEGGPRWLARVQALGLPATSHAQAYVCGEAPTEFLEDCSRINVWSELSWGISRVLTEYPSATVVPHSSPPSPADSVKCFLAFPTLLTSAAHSDGEICAALIRALGWDCSAPAVVRMASYWDASLRHGHDT